MLATLGLSEIAELFAAIPERHRFPELGLGRALSESEALEAYQSLVGHDASNLSFAGAGAYEHYIPAVVDALSARGEFATTYTPYQAEVSQGTLTAIFEYQSMVADLLQMEVVNASHYDGATAAAEACLTALRVKRNATTVLLAETIHPEYIDVVGTYLGPQGFQTRSVPAAADLDAAAEAISEDVAALVVQTPDFLGQIHDLRGLAGRVHERGALLVVITDPIACGMFRPPGADGADIVVGEGQPLGIPLSFGGPYLGLFATRSALARKMPGRVVGQTSDAHGRRGYVLTMNTREQHIRREKATSNICTNQGLMALRAAIYLAAMGPTGLKETAELCYHRGEYAASRLQALPGVELVSKRPFFREFAIRLPVPAAEVISRAGESGVTPGFDLGRYDPSCSHELLIAVTEKRSRAQIDRLVEAVKEALA